MPSPKTLAAVALAVALLGAAAGAANRARPASPASPTPLLWKVSDADNSVYLLGSFHVLKASDYPVSRDVETAFDDAERTVFEVSPEELADPGIAQQAMAVARFEDGRTLESVLPAAARDALARQLSQRGASLAQLEPFEPWFVNLTLVMGLSQSLGFSGEHGLDRHLMQKAAAAGKPAGGLETIAAQMRVLDATPMDEQVAGLVEMIGQPKRMGGMLSTLHTAWRQGDAARLDALTRAEMQRKAPRTYRLLNVERNRAWLPQVDRMLTQSTSDDTLVVVGAMHLLGPEGLVELLRRKGHRVERVCSACSTGTKRR